MPHALSNIQPDARIGDCQECGPAVRISPAQGKGWAGWRCTTRKTQREIERRARLPIEQRRARKRREEYGITDSEYQTLLADQEGLCAICRREKRLVVDHSHDQGHVRGLLCHRCNSGLGYFGEDLALMQAAIAYLARAHP